VKQVVPVSRKEKPEEKEGEQKIAIKRIATPPPAILDHTPKKKKRFPRKSRVLLVLLGIVVLIGLLGYFASTYFARAIFTVKPREIPVTVNSTLIATASPVNGSLTYDLVSVANSATSTVKATIGSYSESKAKGIVTFYNSFSAKSWRLIAGTRFVTSEGLIYRLASTISIPGFTTSSSGVFTPGTITATLIADQVGEEYNAVRMDPLEKLRVVAFEKDPKYETVYAKITGPISGGFKGNKVTVSPSVLASTTVELQSEIIRDSLSHLKSIVPEGYVLYSSAYSAVFSPASVNSLAKTPVVSVRGTVYGILFKKTDLVSKLAGQSLVQSFNGFTFDTDGLEGLVFAISNAKDFSPIKKNNLIIQIKGNMTLLGVVPVQELKSKLAGMALVDTEKVIHAYSPVIDLEKSSGQVVPPWSKVPTNLEKISVVIQD
jgi:hypothetical protein